MHIGLVQEQGQLSGACGYMQLHAVGGGYKQVLVHQDKVVGDLILCPQMKSWKQPGRKEEEPFSAQDRSEVSATQ